MNGFRVARKYIERLSDKDLHELWKTAKEDGSQESMVIMHLIICELSDRRTDLPNTD